jgi:DNA-binding transcriptional ArsR family regulator
VSPGDKRRLLDVAEALRHPTRVRILELMAEGERSPAEIAREIGKEIGHVAYHMRKLIELGAVRETRTRPVRGAIEHFYIRTGDIVPEADANTTLDKIAAIVERVANLEGADWASGIECGFDELREVLVDAGRLGR